MTNFSNSVSSNTRVRQIAELIVRGRWVIVTLFALAALALGFYISQFKIDASADTLLVKNNRLYVESQVANQTFSPDEFILLAYEPKQHAVFSKQTFDDLRQLSDALKQMPRVRAVTSILTVPLIADVSALSGDTDVSRLTWEHQRYSPEQMRSLIVNHPIFTDLLINRDSTATAIQIVFESSSALTALERQITAIQRKVLSGESLTESDEKAIARLQRQADPIRKQLTLQRKKEIAHITAISETVGNRANTYLGGAYVVGQHLIDIIKSDLFRFGLAIAAVILLLLLLLYRSVKWMIFPVMTCVVSVGMTMGLFGFLDMRTTVISANFIALQLILTLAVMIHLIGQYRDVARSDPLLTQNERIIIALEKKLAPCFYATLTTSVGFGALIFSGLQPVVSFGWMMLSAMTITMLVSLLLFPAVLSFLPAQKETQDYVFVTAGLTRLRKLTLSSPMGVATLVVVVFLGLAVGIGKLNVENSFINYFAKDTRVYQELAFIDKDFGGSTSLDIIVDAEPTTSSELVLGARQVGQLQLVQAAIRAFDATGSVTSVVNFTELAKSLNNDKPLTEYELTTLYHILDKQVANQLVGAYFSADSGKYRIATRVQDTTQGLDRQRLMEQINHDLKAVGLSEQQYTLTNLFVLYQDILSRLFDSQIKTLGLVYFVLGGVMLLIFRSVTIAAIALIPNILTTLGILGVIGWLGISLDIMTITIAAIAMGIAVDDTIHFVDSYITGIRDSSDKMTIAQSGSRAAFSHSGLAILFTSVIISAGFSLFGFSDFIPSVYFGLLTALAMMMALFNDLTLLPALLNRFVKS